MHLCPSTSKGATATTMVRWPKTWPTSLNSVSSGSISKTASSRAPGSTQSTSTPGRIAAIRETAEVKGVDLFINARTDLFLGQQGDPANSIDDALDRAKAYAAAGASGFFIPGLRDDALIGRICDGVALPVNVMVMEGVPSTRRLSELGVARVSYGAIPYVRAMKALREDARKVLP